MKKEIEELQDVWLNECDKKHCPIIDYLLHQKSTDKGRNDIALLKRKNKTEEKK